MTAAEIVMKRDDPNIAWGFRLTGGADLGTPFYVVKVLGRGHAERAGLRVGDMVYAINHKYINNFTHKDAQNEILHTGDTLILNIKRGHTEGRGTPLPDYSDPLMGITVPPETPRPKLAPLPPYQPPPAVVKEPSPPESEDEEAEDTVAAFNVKINPKGRIAEIEELPVTPPPSRSPSRARSRSRSMTKDRRRSASAKRESAAAQNSFVPVQNGIGKAQNGFQGVQNGFGGVSGPGESFTYSKEVITQYSTVLSASEQSEGNVSESVNESFVIHGGSTHKMEDVLSPEDIERDIFEEKMEEQKLTELLTGEAEVLEQGVVGINFQKIIPRTDFIKESSVFKELQGAVLKKEESEEEQLKKDPNKRFSTFLQTPKRPIPKPKNKPPPTEDLPWKTRMASPLPVTPSQPQIAQETVAQQETATVAQQQETTTVTTTETTQSTTTHTENVQIVEEMSFTEVQETREEFSCHERSEATEDAPIIFEAVSTENVSEEKVRFKESDEKKEEGCSIEELKEKTPSEGQRSETQSIHSERQEDSTRVEYKSEFERQLAEIQKQIEAIQQLPTVLQANLVAVQEQLAKIVAAKAEADEKEREGEISVLKRDSIRSNLNWQIDATVEENQSEGLEEEKHEEATETSEEQLDGPQPEGQNQQAEENKIMDLELEFGELVEHTEIEQFKNIKNQQSQQQEEDMSVRKPPLIQNFPRTAERPIVLPGGRKWYKPQDAYNEDFIAETIIHQSEVLVGTTIGLNFLKYEPPKFDANNSAVYRMIQEIEGRSMGSSECLPIAARPEKVLAEDDYFPPISKRHFFAARLTEQGNENVEKILQDVNEQNIISV